MSDRFDRALDAVADGTIAVRENSRWLLRWITPVTAASLVVLAAVALFRMEASGANYDPQYMRVIVERTIRYGGSYYENGIHNKGPLEPLVYEVAARIGGDSGFWFMIGVFALIAALCVGLAAALFTIRSGGSVVFGAAVATMAVVHLTLSDADYAGVLYARNITVALLSLAFVAAAFDPAWSSHRRRIASVVVIGLTTGLAVQTLLTACFTASPVLLWAMWTRRDVVVGRWPAWIVMPVVSAASLLSAPLFYFVTGSWRPFIDGWWVYARLMSTGTGRDLGGQVELGWDNLFDYYRDRPALAVVLQVWIVVTAVRWRRLGPAQRSVRVLALFWFVGAWVELALSQRYSSHYFSVLAVPTIMIIGTLVGDVGSQWRAWFSRRAAIAVLPLAVAIGTVMAGGQGPFDVGVEAVSAVRSTDDFERRRDAGIDGRTHVVSAALDLVSVDDDPLLMWTSFPWPYLYYDRVSATRYIWKTFLLGEIYLGDSGPEFVLPGTWDRFDADLDRTDPVAFIVESVNPVEPGTRFEERVERDFTEVFSDDVTSLSYRNDLARWLLDPAPDARPLTPSEPFETGTCLRIDATLDTDSLASEALRVEFGRSNVGVAEASIDLSMSNDGELLAKSNRVGLAGYTGTTALQSPEPTLALIVGARSAVVVVDGQIVAAVDIDDGWDVRLVAGGGAVGDLMRSDPPERTGC